MNKLSKIRKDFPILDSKINGNSLVYLDNGATTHKPKSVIKSISDYYSHFNSNIHRGVHQLSQISTEKYENSRSLFQGFINAQEKEEIIFTSGTTESINLVASSWGEKFLSKGDEVIISTLEHHSNIVPWQMICDRQGAKLVIAPINKDGEIIFDAFTKLLSIKTKMVSIAHISNTLGTILPVKKIIEAAHNIGALVMLDSAQAIAHTKIDVQDLNCDFLAFSIHKMYGPTGVGVLYGKKQILNDIPPYKGGGGMISEVSFEKTIYADLPNKFEAGTPNICGVISSAEAVKYISKVGYNFIIEQENLLLEYATKELKKIDGLQIIGNAKNKASVISFIIDNTHPFDVGTLLDQQGVSVRTGHHCTQALMSFYKIPGTIRASFAFYNTLKEVDIFINAIKKVIKMLG